MIHLKSMTDDEFSRYLKDAIPSYDAGKVQSEGLSDSDALALAQRTFQELLPKGIHSPDHFLFSVFDDDSAVPCGTLWLACRREGSKHYAYIYDIILNPAHRGKGLGRQLMRLMEEEVRRQCLQSVVLHVFEHNTLAIHLYESMGFHTTNRIMSKKL
ncbi:MAG: GNAT family N-acetyltransferase [Methylotenera sp.]|nr:GNAT family N-acetyltransferase [Oligoflexia bacterium]